MTFFFFNHYAPVCQANWSNMNFTAGNLFPSHSCIGWLESSHHWDFNPGPQLERWTTYQLSYPSFPPPSPPFMTFKFNKSLVPHYLQTFKTPLLLFIITISDHLPQMLLSGLGNWDIFSHSSKCCVHPSFKPVKYSVQKLLRYLYNIFTYCSLMSTVCNMTILNAHKWSGGTVFPRKTFKI